MSILDDIVAYKRIEVAMARNAISISSLEKRSDFSRTCLSMKERLVADDVGVIAEFKRRSPSRGIIHDGIAVADVAKGYQDAGVAAISVLTDNRFFGGSNHDLTTVRNMVSCPVLRKDFVVDEYQLIEAKSIGADVVLLIAGVLAPVAIKSLCEQAHGLGLEVLLEVHNEQELDATGGTSADMIGVNNRDLKTFKVSVETSKRLADLIPSRVKVSESGIESPGKIKELRGFGYNGFLIGQTFMEQPDPGRAAAEFIFELKKTTSPSKP